MDWNTIRFALLTVFAGGLLQGTVAFGFGLLSVPLLLMAGFPMPMVLAIVSVSSAAQTGSAAHHLRHAVPWRRVAVSAGVRAVALLLGVAVLRILVEAPGAWIRFWVGVMVFSMLCLQAAWRPQPRAKLPWGWDAVAFAASGFIGGLCGMGGPPLVLWVMAHDWPAVRTRAFLFASFVSLVPLQLMVLYWTFGDDVLRGILLGAALVPAVILGSLLGMRVGGRFSKAVLRRLAFIVLLLIAWNAMIPQLARWYYGVSFDGTIQPPPMTSSPA